ncbi:MAG: bifunctional nuclease family protein [Treponema sp.]|jgi:bifunctional DNase/RNase|nr:bifunctional nuclease family protein [Treponema sp.]
MYNMKEVELWTIARKEQGALVGLKLIDEDLAIPVFVGFDEVQSILTAYHAPDLTRPAIHDVLLELVQQMGLALFRVELYTIKDNLFYARLFFSAKPQPEGKEDTKNTFLMVHGRPADAVALAVRSKCPLYVSQRVVDQVGVPLTCFTQGIERTGQDGFDIPQRNWKGDYLDRGSLYRRSLGPERASVTEVYEQAEDIRDILVLLGTIQEKQVP